jgi:hypothetical protein
MQKQYSAKGQLPGILSHRFPKQVKALPHTVAAKVSGFLAVGTSEV